MNFFANYLNPLRQRHGRITSGLNHVAHAGAKFLFGPNYNNEYLNKFGKKYFGGLKGGENIEYTIEAPRDTFLNSEGFFEYTSGTKRGTTAWGITNKCQVSLRCR